MSTQYNLIVVDGSSPFTTQPSTVFMQPVVGILKDTHCPLDYSGVTKPKDINKPQTSRNPLKPNITCPTDAPAVEILTVGEIFQPKGIEIEGFGFGKYLAFDTNLFEKIGKEKLKALKHGAHTLDIIYTYPFEVTCEQQIGVLVIEADEEQCAFNVPDIYVRMGDVIHYDDFIHDSDEAAAIQAVTFKMDTPFVLERYGHMSLLAKLLGDVQVTVIFKYVEEQFEFDEDGNFQVLNMDKLKYCVQHHTIRVVTAEEAAALDEQAAGEEQP